jgi:hypothetical protein
LYEGCRHIVRPAKFYLGLGFEIKGQLEPPFGYCGGFDGDNGPFRLGEAVKAVVRREKPAVKRGAPRSI